MSQWERGDKLAWDLKRDVVAGLVVFLVALPLCLGLSLASGAPLIAGLIAGIIGGIVVGALSGSATSVSGPTASLTVIVFSQIERLGSFETFLAAVVVAGVVQVAMGYLRLGSIAAFCPSSVIQGLITGVSLILILKQAPHLFGHDADPEGEMAFQQPDHRNTFTEILDIFRDMHPGAALIGLTALALLIAWDRWKIFDRTGLPGPLAAVAWGYFSSLPLRLLGPGWTIEASHLVQVPVAENIEQFASLLPRVDLLRIVDPAVLLAGCVIAVVASLETLLNLEAVDKLDPKRRTSSPNRELVAQGYGNVLAGLAGGLPIASVIIRGTVNIQAGATSKLSTMAHGLFLLSSLALAPSWLNVIPLSSLAAILLHAGSKLSSWETFSRMWRGGLNRFLPFIATVGFIVFTDLLVGVVLGLIVAICFILHENLRRPIRQLREKHAGSEVLRIELADQVSFLNKAALAKVLKSAQADANVLLDASHTEYIDPDVLDLIREFQGKIAPAHGARVSLVGFKDHYEFRDQIHYVDYTTQEVQRQIGPSEVIDLLRQGNQRFRTGTRLTRDLVRLKALTAHGQFPLAVILSCIDSRAPVELIFDMALGDAFSIRIAGNVANEQTLGSLEYACVAAGAKLAVVLGHTRCGAVTSAINSSRSGPADPVVARCEHLTAAIKEIQRSIDADESDDHVELGKGEGYVDAVARRNVTRSLEHIRSASKPLAALERDGRIAMIGGMYNLDSGEVDFFGGLTPHPALAPPSIVT